ncbi:MAG TPA: biotin--[acetyl-CoA-carboxylase] ligase [Burkholderiales bacterium]|nr:biotin--[acetyl-CoA-carboxylase] ligase [Burkholderiales bacterium]
MTPLAFTVLRRLADGEFHSGEAIARELGISRGSVWNALHAAEQAGVRTFKLPGRGYRLAHPVDWLDAARVREAMGDASRVLTLEMIDQAESTSSLLLERCAAGERHGLVLAAELQSAGRGRRGRGWHSALGEGLTFSLLWRFSRGPAGLAGLSLAVGVALARACDALGVEGIRLKWPNDVVHGAGKLAGTLIEVQGEMQGPSWAVIGIGINLRLAPESRSRIDQPVADLASLAPELPARSRVLGVVLDHVAQVLSAFEAGGFAVQREEWTRRHAFQDRKVAVLLPGGGTLEGVARGVEEDGSLLLQTPSGMRRLFGGEVSLRERA